MGIYSLPKYIYECSGLEPNLGIWDPHKIESLMSLRTTNSKKANNDSNIASTTPTVG